MINSEMTPQDKFMLTEEETFLLLNAFYNNSSVKL